MKDIDRVLEHLRDSKWHEVEDIELATSMPDKKLIEVLHFLEEQALIITENEKLRITPKGLKFLDLPP